MIYFGTHSKSMDPVGLAGLDCPNCGHRSLYLTLYHTFAHIWFIPIFPVAKFARVKCISCFKIWEEPEMEALMAGSAGEVKRESPAPKYLFAGLYLAGIFIVSMLYSNWKEDKNTAEYIADPHRQDLYVMESRREPEYPNIIMKVADVKGDSVAMMVGSYAYSSADMAARAVSEGALDEPGYFMEGGVLSREELLDLYDLKKIVQIIREEE